MSGPPRTTAERYARLRRDQEAYRRISLARRSQARFRRDLSIVPHVFLLPGRAWMAPLRQPSDAVRLALQGEAIWTLDTAARLVTGRGILVSGDLTGYLSESAFRRAVAEKLVGEPTAGGLSVAPLFRRPLMLIAHLSDDLPAAVTLPTGDRVVPWSLLIRDVLGTLGWRPDLLARLEAAGPAAFPELEVRAADHAAAVQET